MSDNNQDNVVNEVVVDETSFKVFCGNLDYTVTEEELKEAFAGAGTVVSTAIITRWRRPLGYGFVTFSSVSEAEAAITLMHEKEIKSRTINVQPARPKTNRSERPKRYYRRRPRKSRQPKKESNEESSDAVPSSADSVPVENGATPDPASAPTGEAEVSKKTNGKKFKKRRPRRNPNNGNNSGSGGESSPVTTSAPTEATEARIDSDDVNDVKEPAQESNNNSAPATTEKRRRRKQRGPRKAPPTESESEGSPVEGAAKNAEAPRPRPQPRHFHRRRAPRVARDGPVSKTKLYVCNLPYKVDSDALAGIFKDFNVTEAKVITLPDGRSKGFGFVSVADETEQAKVLNDLSHIQVDGRELIIKAALESENSDSPTQTPAETPAQIPAQ